MFTKALDLGKQVGFKAYKISKSIVVETVKLPVIYVRNIIAGSK